MLFGVERKVRWGAPDDEKVFKAREDWGACTNDGLTIILNPLLRRKSQRASAWQVFNHELGHMFNCAMSGKYITYQHRTGHVSRDPWVDISHNRMDQSAVPMGALMRENPGIFSPATE